MRRPSKGVQKSGRGTDFGNAQNRRKNAGIEYSSNLCDDDRPYFKDLGQGETLLEIPIHWANYDLPYFAFNVIRHFRQDKEELQDMKAF